MSFPPRKSQDLPTAGTSPLFIFSVAPAGREFVILVLHAGEPGPVSSEAQLHSHTSLGINQSCLNRGCLNRGVQPVPLQGTVPSSPSPRSWPGWAAMRTPQIFPHGRALGSQRHECSGAERGSGDAGSAEGTEDQGCRDRLWHSSVSHRSAADLMAVTRPQGAALTDLSSPLSICA